MRRVKTSLSGFSLLALCAVLSLALGLESLEAQQRVDLDEFDAEIQRRYERGTLEKWYPLNVYGEPLSGWQAVRRMAQKRLQEDREAYLSLPQIRVNPLIGKADFVEVEQPEEFLQIPEMNMKFWGLRFRMPRFKDETLELTGVLAGAPDGGSDVYIVCVRQGCKSPGPVSRSFIPEDVAAGNYKYPGGGKVGIDTYAWTGKDYLQGMPSRFVQGEDYAIILATAADNDSELAQISLNFFPSFLASTALMFTPMLSPAEFQAKEEKKLASQDSSRP